MLFYFDLETTGLNQYHHKITDICIIKENYSTERHCDKFSTLVNPVEPISEFITKLTGINDEMVKNQPTFRQIANNVFDFLQNKEEPNGPSYLVAHNCDGFDKLVLRIHFKNCGINTNDFNWKYIDTLLFAKKLYPTIYKHNLKNLIKILGLKNRDAHRAENDTLMLKDLYRKMCYDLSVKQKIDYDFLMRNPEIVWQYINN